MEARDALLSWGVRTFQAPNGYSNTVVACNVFEEKRGIHYSATGVEVCGVSCKIMNEVDITSYWEEHGLIEIWDSQNNESGSGTRWVANSQTCKVLRSGLNLEIKVVENVAAKILVRCSRQKALIKVYRHLVDYQRNVFNLCSFPDLVGTTYKQLRRGVEGAIVCGLYRDGKLKLHSNDDEILRQTDSVLLIGPGNTGKIKMQLAFLDAEEDKVITKNLPVPKALVRFKECILLLGWREDVTEMIKEYYMCLCPGCVLFGSPFHANSLENAMVNVGSSINGDKIIPFSIIVMYDKEWSTEDSFKYEK